MLPAIIVLTALVIAGLGVALYMGWFKLSTSRDTHKRTASATVAADIEKFQADKAKAADKVKAL